MVRLGDEGCPAQGNDDAPDVRALSFSTIKVM